ncbi:hypothetical protein CABS01_06687 [Colletotrichum abscissum]|uniref:Uncharacterized protein n=1 Tax=Colletotrichum abscissum TaxID=1671311 RepID=A0A9P9XJ72_9PEZI|nr:uncharacterized protein CABS01_06687 [Colletotrichum abscissum]KAI3554709.1 hypothetical protein CABS02_05190 [Colletotrichum abscissum]KAK1514708.1 hypothetical protein CABS01_06687 [Colletotrichum abscissum]
MLINGALASSRSTSVAFVARGVARNGRMPRGSPLGLSTLEVAGGGGCSSVKREARSVQVVSGSSRSSLEPELCLGIRFLKAQG